MNKFTVALPNQQGEKMGEAENMEVD